MRAWKPPLGFVPLITIEDIRTKRSVSDFIAFWRTLYDTIQYGSNRGHKLWLRHRADSAAKALSEEVIPLCLVLDHEEDIPRDTFVFVPCDNGADDARLLDFPRDGYHQPIQITVASWDADEALRMEYLTKGLGTSVNAFGPMTRDKKTKNPQRLPCKFSRQNEIGHEYARKTVERIKQKEQSNYPTGTWLIVEIRDTTAGDRNDLREFVCAEVGKACLESQFKRIYLVSPNDQGFRRRVR